MIAPPRSRAALPLALAVALVLALLPGTPPASAQEPVPEPQHATSAAHASSAAHPSSAAHAAAVQAWRGTTAPAAWEGGGADVPEAGDPAVVPGRLLVTTAPSAAPAAAFAAAGFADATAIAPSVTAVAVAPGTEAAAAAALRARADVVAVEPDRIRTFTAVPDDALYPQQWAHQRTGIEAAWEVTTGSADVLVAVADSGIVADHPDLAGIVEQVDASSGEIRPGHRDNDPCQVGHGTWVAGVLGAVGGNGIGVAGTSWGGLSILDINTADPAVTCSGPTDAGTIAAIAYAAERGADVVNLSLGGPGTSCPTAMQQAVDAARAAGTVVVAAAGNSGESTPQVPASCGGVISVGATGPDDAPAAYSTTGPHVDVVAPGGAGAGDALATEIATTSWWAAGRRTPEYTGVAGTSFATPYVAGLAALIRAVRPELSPDQVESLLESTATDLGAPGRDDATGWGLVQGAAVVAAAAGDPVPPPAPDPAFPVGDAPEPGSRPGGPVAVFRVAAGTGTTEPITQAVAVSRSVFADAAVEPGEPAGDPGGDPAGVPARWAVLARADDHADALAGASLSLGVAPLLFTGAQGPLAAPTAGELTRTLPPGAVVYLLGGEAALPAGLDAEVAALGFTPVRLAGPLREATAVAIADELDARLVELGIGPSPTAILVNRQEWPDAIAAGQLGAQFGYPILLTPAEQLSPITGAALEARDLQELLVVGGTVRVSDAAQAAALQQTDLEGATRLAGEERNGTVVAVSAAVEAILAQTAAGRPANALAVDTRRPDAYAHMLSATVPIAAFTGVLLPVDGQAEGGVPAVTGAYARGLGLPLGIMGDVDLIPEATAGALEAIVEAAPQG